MQAAINATVRKRKLDKAQLERPEVSFTLPNRQPTGVVFAQEPSEVLVAAIFYNEAEYIKEWIDFHLMIVV